MNSPLPLEPIFAKFFFLKIFAKVFVSDAWQFFSLPICIGMGKQRVSVVKSLNSPIFFDQLFFFTRSPLGFVKKKSGFGKLPEIFRFFLTTGQKFKKKSRVSDMFETDFIIK